MVYDDDDDGVKENHRDRPSPVTFPQGAQEHARLFYRLSTLLSGV